MQKISFSYAFLVVFTASISTAQEAPLNEVDSSDTSAHATQIITMDWSWSAESAGEPRDAISRLYTSLYNISQIDVVTVRMEEGDETITDAMIRYGSWPEWIPSVDARMDRTLCSMNVENGKCRFSENSGNPIWTAGPNDQLIIPDYNFDETYRTRIVPSERILNGGPFSTTTNAKGVLCGVTTFDGCSNADLQWDEAKPILLIESGGDQFSNIPERMRPGVQGFVKTDSERRIVAYPEIGLKKPVTVNLSGPNAPTNIQYDDFRSNISPDALFIENLQFESDVGEKWKETFSRPIDTSIELRMGFRNHNGERLQLPLDSNSREKEVYIFHFDRAVDFDHCFFEPYKSSMAIHDISNLWENYFDWDSGFLAPLGKDCEISINEDATVASTHGTHTLGTFLRFLAAPIFHAPDDPNEGVWPDADSTRIYHFPLRTVQGRLENANEFENVLNQIAFFSEVNLFEPVIVISASWAKSGAERIEKVILDNLTDAHFIVAAPRGEDYNTCVRHPAGIRERGKLAKNIISVVGFDLAREGDDGFRTVAFENSRDGSYGACHDVGAIGSHLGPTTGSQMATMKGSSNATPVVGAVAAHILRLAPRPMEPEELSARLISSSHPPNRSRPEAKGAMIKFSDASNFIEALIVIESDGQQCKYFGDFERIVRGQGTALASLQVRNTDNREQFHINRTQIHRLHKRPDGNFWVVWEGPQRVTSSANIEISQRIQNTHSIEFDVRRSSNDNNRACREYKDRSYFLLKDLVDLLDNEI